MTPVIVFKAVGLLVFLRFSFSSSPPRLKYPGVHTSAGAPTDFVSRTILIPMPSVSGGSHCQQIATISSALVRRGHEVHLIGNSLKRDSKTLDIFESSKIIRYEVPGTTEDWQRNTDQILAKGIEEGPGIGGFSLYTKVMDGTLGNDCRRLLSNTTIIQRLRDEAYNLLISDMFTPCDALLARYLDIPFVAMTTSREYPLFRGRIYGFPSELSYVPESFFGLTDKMTFLQRVQNVLGRVAVKLLVPPLLLNTFEQLQEDFQIDTDTHILDIMGKASLWLSYTSLALDFPQPSMQNHVSIGGMAIKPLKPLTQKLENFVSGSGEHGVVVFSLGSSIHSSNIDHALTLAKVFGKLQQRVIWGYDDEDLPRVNNNTMFLKKIPLTDILGHQKTRLLISHGGLNSIYEALYHAVPMVVIPNLAPDQWDTAARVVSKGMGLQLEYKTFTETTFHDAVKEVLNNKRYQERVSHYSAILRDLPPAKDRAVFWIEHVLKFGDGHLRARVFEVNFIQYYLLDVAAFFLLIAAASVLLLRYSCILCYRVIKKGIHKKKVE